tara:strand:- start:588 stop:701 length:114 start_codon:yes stop_codon:yes gene_type:complete
MVALVFDQNAAFIAVSAQLIESAFFGESLRIPVSITD